MAIYSPLDNSLHSASQMEAEIIKRGRRYSVVGERWVSMRRRQVLAALGTTVIAGCTAPPTSPDPLPGESESAWAQYGRSAAHTAANSVVAVDNPTPQWRTRTSGPLSAPVVVGDTLVVAEGIPQSAADMPQGSVAVYDRRTGSRHWRTPFPIPPATGDSLAVRRSSITAQCTSTQENG